MRSRFHLSLALSAALLLGACGGDETTLDSQGNYFAPTAAVVCGEVSCEKISESTINLRLASAVKNPATASIFLGDQGTANRLDAQREILSDLVRLEVGLQAARVMNIAVDEADIDRRLEEVKSGYPDEETFQEALKVFRLTEEELREDLTEQHIMDRVRETVGRNARATPQEIEQYFQLNKSQFDEQIKVAHIVVCENFDQEQRSCEATPADQAQANSIAARARGGDDFAAMAREFSVDTVSREQGGELEFFSRGDVIEQLEEVAFGLFQPGDISDPVQTPFGFHVLKLIAVGRPFEEAEPLISQALSTQKGNAAFEEWLIDALKGAQVRVNPKLGVFDEISHAVVPRTAVQSAAGDS